MKFKPSILLIDPCGKKFVQTRREDLACCAEKDVWLEFKSRLKGDTPQKRAKEAGKIGFAKQAVTFLCAPHFESARNALPVVLELYDLLTDSEPLKMTAAEIDRLQDKFCNVGIVPFYIEGLPNRDKYRALVPAQFPPSMVEMAERAAMREVMKDGRQRHCPTMFAVVELKGKN